VLQAPEIVGRVCRVAREACEATACDDGTDPITDQEVISHLRDFEALWDELYPGEQARIVGLVVREAVVWDDHLDLVFHDRGIAALASEVSGSPDITPGEPLTLSMEFSTRQYGGRKQIILPDGTSPVFPDNPPPDPRAVYPEPCRRACPEPVLSEVERRSRRIAIARAYAWMEAMDGGKFRTLTQLAQAVGVDEGYVRRQMSEMLDFEALIRTQNRSD